MKKYWLILFIFSLFMVACSSQGTDQPSAPASLTGAWKLTAYGSADAPIPAVEGADAGLTFNEDGTVTGSSGCNGLGGDYTVEANEITFGEFVSTLMACEDPLMAQEDAARQVLTDTATYHVVGTTLTLANNGMVLVLTR